MTIYKCPDCPTTVDSESAERAVKSRLAQHMSQRADHKYRTHVEALSHLNSAGMENLEAGESSSNAEGSKPSPSDGASTQGSTQSSSESVLLRTPAIATDGGADECPECEEGMKNATEGWILNGVVNGRERNFVTEGGESFCPDCDIVVDSDGNVVRHCEVVEE